MDPSDPCGLGNLLGEHDMLRFSSAVSDHCPAIAMMFNATNDCDDEAIVEACKDLVYLQCWPHIVRKVCLHRKSLSRCSETCHAGHADEIPQPGRQGFHGGRGIHDAPGPNGRTLRPAGLRCISHAPVCVHHTGAPAQLADGLCSMLGETDVADWFEKEYCEAPWNGWWIGDC